MNRLWLSLVAFLVLPLAGRPAEPPAGASESLLVRYAFLVGGREAGSAPRSAGVLSREELTKVLLDWNPGADNAEVRRVFALNHLGEVARQAVQIPQGGGQVAGEYAFGGASFEMRLDVKPAADGTVTVAAQMLRNGRLFSAPTVRQRLGERAILSSTGGPEAAFVFFVVEVNRISAETLARGGLRLAWRPNVKVVDGQKVLPPKILQGGDAVYPPAAKKAGVAGDVVLRLLVGKTGSVEDVEVLKGLPEGLTDAAVEAVRRWKFEPGRVDGRPEAVLFTMTVHFEPK
jgi:TonB family protein